MLHASDQAYIVVDGMKRNRSMMDFIRVSAMARNSRVFQLVGVAGSPSYWHPGIRIGSLDDLQQQLRGEIHSVLDVASVTSPTAAQVLATSTRRSDLSGPPLQRVHREVGRFLADQLIDAYPFAGLVESQVCEHVQAGKRFAGLVTSRKVILLAMMRGGGPMAEGVYERFPDAAFVHYVDGRDIRSCLRLNEGQGNTAASVLIVDSVVNSGHSVRRVISELEQRASEQKPPAKLSMFVLTGVMQRESADSLPVEFPRVRFLTLRVSDNKYVGKGGTDTGNRLFGTT